MDLLYYLSSFFSWSELPPMQSARACVAVEWLPDGRIIAVGGHESGVNPVANVEMLECPWSTEEPANGEWQYVAPMNHTRTFHAVTFFSGKVIAAGGNERESVEYFTLPTVELPRGQWVLMRPMISPALLAGLHAFGDDLLFIGKL